VIKKINNRKIFAGNPFLPEEPPCTTSPDWCRGVMRSVLRYRVTIATGGMPWWRGRRYNLRNREKRYFFSRDLPQGFWNAYPGKCAWQPWSGLFHRISEAGSFRYIHEKYIL